MDSVYVSVKDEQKMRPHSCEKLCSKVNAIRLVLLESQLFTKSFDS